MTKWVDESSLKSGERERIFRASAFQPTLELSAKTGLPEVAITEAVCDNLSGKYLGREYFDVYPRGYLLPGESWAGPNVAYKYACIFFNEALYLEDPKFKALKIECARSAELLFLHSAFGSRWEKTPATYRQLARLYMMDLSCGIYWMAGDGQVAAKTYPKLLQISSFDERVIYCLKKAIELGDIRAKCLLGDAYFKGIGTRIDLWAAFKCYLETLEKPASCANLTLGIANSRIGVCYEQGFGADLNFEKAKTHFERAIKLLDRALDEGEDFYEFEFVFAQKALERVKQNLTEDGAEKFGYEYSFRKRRYCD